MSAKRTAHAPKCAVQRRGFALLAVLLLLVLLLVLLIAVTTQLSAATFVETVSATRRSHGLAHELAVDSTMLRLREQLRSQENRPSDIERDLDERGSAARDWRIGPVAVHLEIQDDGARFNPLPWQRDDQRGLRWNRVFESCHLDSAQSARVRASSCLGSVQRSTFVARATTVPVSSLI